MLEEGSCLSSGGYHMWLVGPDTVSASLLHDGHKAGNEMCIDQAGAKKNQRKMQLEV